jgi:hypothetical protein
VGKNIALLAAVGLVVIGSVQAAEQPKAVRQSAQVELQGRFQVPLMVAEKPPEGALGLIGVQGKSIWLVGDGPVCDQARRLDGRYVAAQGYFQTRHSGRMDDAPVLVFVTSDMQWVEPNGGPRADLQGVLRMNAQLGYPGQPASVIEVGGQTYVLDFGKDLDLRTRAALLDRKPVRLTGRLNGFQSATTMCVPWRSEYPVILVEAVEAVAEERVP